MCFWVLHISVLFCSVYNVVLTSALLFKELLKHVELIFFYVQNMINSISLSETYSWLIMMTNYTSGDINCSLWYFVKYAIFVKI